MEPKELSWLPYCLCSWHKAISRAILHKEMFDTFAGTDGDSATISEDDMQLVLAVYGPERVKESDKVQIRAMLKRLDTHRTGW